MSNPDLGDDSVDASSSDSDDGMSSTSSEEDRSTYLGWKLPAIGLGACLTSALLCLALPSLRYWGRGGLSAYLFYCRTSPHVNEDDVLFFWAALVEESVMGAIAAVLLATRHRSSHLRATAMYAVALWVTGLSNVLRLLLQPDPSDLGHMLDAWFVWPFCGIVYHSALLFLAMLSISRVKTLETSMGGAFGVHFLWLLVGIAMAIWVFAFTAFHAGRILQESQSWAQGQKLIHASYVFEWISMGTSFAFLARVLHILYSPLASLRQVRQMLGKSVGRDMAWAYNAVLLQFVGTLICWMGITFRFLASKLYRLERDRQYEEYGDDASINRYAWLSYFDIWTYLLDFGLQSAGALILSGVLSTPPPSRNFALVEGLRQSRRDKAMSLSAPNADSRWEAKVEELAHRGFTLAKLLDFYAHLASDASCMPHFDPDVHTTGDVVWGAIIPMTASAGLSYAEMMMGGIPTRPSAMVTHCWANLFRDLVAAIVADALGFPEFTVPACLLDNNMPYLRQLLRDEGTLGANYWVCAFSVAQHASICSTNLHGKRDPVTGRLHPSCTCSTPKFFNDTDPLTSDGKSIGCEMNKFSDMIRYLALSDDNFRQVIAVDNQFVLFSRCWCIAEVAESYRLGLEQNVKIKSRRLLRERARALRKLDIQKMEGSRPEDIHEILSSIPDKARFNGYLQTIFFDRDVGLISKWSDVDSKESIRRAGTASRHVAACLTA